MNTLKIIIIILLSLFALMYLIFLIRTGKPIRTAFFFALLGVAAVTVIDLTSKYTGVYVPLNYVNAAVTCFLGIPGVTALILLKLII